MGNKRRLRGRGSGISTKDIGRSRKSIPKIDPDYHRQATDKFKIAPARLPEDMTKEEFNEELAEQPYNPEDHAEISTEEFLAMLKDPKYTERRKTRTRRERQMQALMYFDSIDERQWVNDQLKLLYYVDEKRFVEDQIIYKVRIDNTMERIQKRHKQLLRTHPDLAAPFAAAGWKVIDGIHKPKRKLLGSIAIIKQQRRYALEGKYHEMQSLANELNPILNG